MVLSGFGVLGAGTTRLDKHDASIEVFSGFPWKTSYFPHPRVSRKPRNTQQLAVLNVSLH